MEKYFSILIVNFLLTLKIFDKIIIERTDIMALSVLINVSLKVFLLNEY